MIQKLLPTRIEATTKSPKAVTIRVIFQLADQTRAKKSFTLSPDKVTVLEGKKDGVPVRIHRVHIPKPRENWQLVVYTTAGEGTKEGFNISVNPLGNPGMELKSFGTIAQPHLFMTLPHHRSRQLSSVCEIMQTFEKALVQQNTSDLLKQVIKSYLSHDKLGFDQLIRERSNPPRVPPLIHQIHFGIDGRPVTSSGLPKSVEDGVLRIRNLHDNAIQYLWTFESLWSGKAITSTRNWGGV